MLLLEQTKIIMKTKTALIIGASGLTGNELLKFLINTETYEKVIVLVRKPLIIENKKIEQLIVDFNNLGQYKEKFKADDVFCCLGTTIKKAKTKEAFKMVDLHYPLEIARMTKENGARQFLIISSMGANSKSSIFYSQVKGTMEDEIKKIGFESVHIFRPSLLLGKRDEFRLGEYFGTAFFKLVSWLFVGKLKRYRGIQAATVASAMCKTAQIGRKGVNIYLSDEIKEIK